MHPLKRCLADVSCQAISKVSRWRGTPASSGSRPACRGEKLSADAQMHCQLPASSSRTKGVELALVQERSGYLISVGALGDLRLPPRGENLLRQTEQFQLHDTSTYQRSDCIHGQLRCKVADLCSSVSCPLFGLRNALICQSIRDMSPVVGIDANELCFESGTPPRVVTSVACIETVNDKTKA